MTSGHTDIVVIAFDGSAPSRAAVRRAGRLFPHAEALVVTSWRSLRDAAGAARAAVPQNLIEDAVRNLDAAEEAEALATAEEGAGLARDAGMQASAEALCADPSVQASILAAADEHDAVAIVVGSRGRSGLRLALLGSVANAIVHGSKRPVVVVHPGDGD